MAAELLLSTLKKPETPLASQPKAVKPPTVTPEPVTGLPPQVSQPIAPLPSQAVNKSSLTWSTEPAINPAFKTPQVSATPQAVTTEIPWKGTEGFNPNYTPISDRDAAFGDPSLTREQKNILTQNLLKSKGLDTGAQIPQTDEDQFRIMRENQIAEQTFLDKQIQQGLAKAKRDLEGSRGAIEATVGAVNREGMTSASNQMVATKALEGFNAQFNQLSEQYAEQQRQLRKAQQQENWAAVDRISRNMENTQLALQASSAKAKEEAQGWVEFYKDNGVFDTATPEQLDALAVKHGMDPMVMRAAAETAKYKNFSERDKAQLEFTTKGLDSMGKIFEQGGDLSIDDVTSLADSLNVPLESAISLYKSHKQNRDDKSLSNEERALKNKQAVETVKQMQRGIFTDKARDIERIKELRRSGDIESAKLLERALGVDDLSVLADVAYKNALTNYQKSSTAKNYQEVLDAQREYNSVNGGTAFLPSGKFTVEQVYATSGDPAIRIGVKDGQALDIPGTERREDWCGAFVNDALGTRFKNLFTEKMALVNSAVPAPGMAFVQETSQPAGHVGIVESVNLVNGTMNVVEANWQKGSDGKGIISRRTMNISDASGFVAPPNSVQTGTQQGSALSQIPKHLISPVTTKAGQFDGEQQVKTFQTIQTMRNKAASVPNDTQNPQDDQLLVYTFAKAMDPSSAVREGEYDTIQGFAQTALERFGVNSKRFYSNSPFLTKEARENIKKSIEKAYKAEEESYDQVRSQYIKGIDALAGKPVGAAILQDYKNPLKQAGPTVLSQEDEDAQLLTSFQSAPSNDDLDYWNTLK